MAPLMTFPSRILRGLSRLRAAGLGRHARA